MKYVYGIIIAILIVVSGFIYLEQKPEDTTSISVKDVAITNMTELNEIEKQSMYVHITGGIKSAGVYDIEEGLRLYELIDLAGGFTNDADEDYLNLAREVFDGEQIHVPFIQDDGTVVSDQLNNKININRSDKEALMGLVGIGEIKADSIIAYRIENGPFKKIEDIMMVDGIKEAMYNKIKDDIVI